jgi:adenylate cyclase
MPFKVGPTHGAERARALLRWPLRAKWTLALLSVAIVPMAVVGLLVLDIQRKGLARAEKEVEAAVVDEAATQVMRLVDEASAVTVRARRVFADETLDVEARVRVLGELAAATPSIEGIAFFDDTGRFVDAFVSTESQSRGRSAPSARDNLSLPPGSSTGFRIITIEDSPVLRYEARLEGPVRGIIAVALRSSAIDARLADLSRVRFQAPGRVYLVDESLRLVAGRTTTKSGLPVFESVGWTAKFFSAELLLTTEFVDAGVEKVGTIRTMPVQHLALVVERPASEAFAALASARTALLVVLAAFAGIAALAGFFVVRRVLGPIRTLMALVSRYARRDFRARSEVRSGDELEALGSSLEKMADDLHASEQEIEARARDISNLRRYMPKEAAEAAIDEDNLALGGAKKRVTIVFADVVAFTGFAEKTTPERAVAFLNELFTMLSEIVFRHDGMVDKFIGDCIMAVFHAPASGVEHDETPGDGSRGSAAGGTRDDVARALAAAEDMHAFVASNLPRWREAYDFDVELGIGVSRGDVLIGNLGSSTRMEYTVIGDAVNVAARLETLASARQTLATQEVVAACPDVAFTSLGVHALRGKAQPVEVFEVVS